MAVAATPPSGILPHFTRLIEAMKRGLGEGIERWQGRGDTPRDGLGALSLPLLQYLAATLRRFAALHARFAAGLAPARPRRMSRRPAAEGARAERRPPAIPPGPVLSQLGLGAYADQLRALLDDAEMRALLAAAPQAGRLLRPLWRKLTPERLPEVLRLPRRPRPARSATARPDLRLVTMPDGTTLWEPIPCLPFSSPPQWVPARAAEPPAPTPPPAARPAEWGRPASPARPRIPWAMGLFQR